MEYSKEVKDKNAKGKNTGQKSKTFHLLCHFGRLSLIFDFEKEVVNMEEIIEMGVWAIIGIAMLGVLTTMVMHFLAQRSQQHMNETSQSNLYNLHSLGIQAIIGANEMKIVDESLESRKSQEQPAQGGSKT
jgi:hypothetical protein